MRIIFPMLLMVFSGMYHRAAVQLKWVLLYKLADSVAAIGLLRIHDAL
ncbi:MAG: hypothetical protein ACTHMM_25830 [Agriterribacter sp.]